MLGVHAVKRQKDLKMRGLRENPPLPAGRVMTLIAD